MDAEGEGVKLLPNKGWPAWAEGVLSAERIAKVEAYNRQIFTWTTRRERLFAKVAAHQVGCRERAPDLVTLAECDHFADFWRPRLNALGFEAIWRKRPRDASRDGCAIAWRDSTFECVAYDGLDFGSKLGSKTPDRTCLFALLRWRQVT